jgi:hypothetical protein
MPFLDPQTPQRGILTNKTAGIQGFAEANLIETHFRARVCLSNIVTAVPGSNYIAGWGR